MATYVGLKEELAKVKGTTFCGLTTRTNVKLKGGKKNPMQGRVTKKMEDANVILFSNTEDSGYVSLVRKRMLAEGKILTLLSPSREHGVYVKVKALSLSTTASIILSVSSFLLVKLLLSRWRRN